MGRFRSCVAIILNLLLSSAASAEWVLVSSHDFSGLRLSHYIDPARISKDGSTIKYFHKEVSDRAQELKGQKIGYRLLLERVRCDDFATLELHRWVYPEGTGMPIVDIAVNPNEQRWKENAPDTIGERIAAFVCETAKSETLSRPKPTTPTPSRGKLM